MSTVANLGLGTAPLAGLYEAVDPDVAVATIDAAWSLGLRFFDTAPLYGSGVAEERLGRALATRPRHEYTVSTKVGRVLRPGSAPALFAGASARAPVFDFSPSGVRESLAQSLERLRLDHVDVAFLHDPEHRLEEARRAIGIVRALVPTVGVGTNHVETARWFVERGAVDVVLLAGRYTLLDRSAGDELLPLCEAARVPVIAAGVFNSGVLAGGSSFDYHEATATVLAVRERLERACARYDVPLAAAAIQFPFRNPAVTSVLVGARSPAEITEDVELLHRPVPEELWDELDASATH
jgi:D-threo-aldose 1-dehydrogenase